MENLNYSSVGSRFPLFLTVGVKQTSSREQTISLTGSSLEIRTHQAIQDCALPCHVHNRPCTYDTLIHGLQWDWSTAAAWMSLCVVSPATRGQWSERDRERRRPPASLGRGSRVVVVCGGFFCVVCTRCTCTDQRLGHSQCIHQPF